MWEGGCGQYGKSVLPHSPPPHARVDSECKRWNLEHVVLDLFSHFTFGKVQVQWLFVSCRGSRSPNSPFAFSRLANLTHVVATRLRLSVPTWQHVHRRVLRELGIEFEPGRRWTRQFLQSLHLSWEHAATCTRHRPSEADIARERELPQLRVIHLCARFGISQDRMWNLDETAVRLVPKKPSQPMSSPRAPSSRSHLLQTREAACGHRLSMRRRPIECTLMDHSFRASSCPTLRRTGSRRRHSWT